MKAFDSSTQTCDINTQPTQCIKKFPSCDKDIYYRPAKKSTFNGEILEAYPTNLGSVLPLDSTIYCSFQPMKEDKRRHKMKKIRIERPEYPYLQLICNCLCENMQENPRNKFLRTKRTPRQHSREDQHGRSLFKNAMGT